MCLYRMYRGHGSLLAAEAIKNGVDILVAVGGDGTINEVATEVEGTDKLMGIIPFGSGNGLGQIIRDSS
jgi:diacylglycerol kinase (ATP)